uniref:TonB-dependent receptor plug domain-containing protein n=1 Tax=Lutibacter sp. TaxID=1925666 RepID=UPI003567DF7B
EIDFSSEITLVKYSLFGQISKKYLNSKLGTSVGFRMDGLDYNSEMSNVFNQFSPRLSVSYQLNSKVAFNGSAGSYYQLPSYTVLGYRNSANELVNKSNNLNYINARHIVTGVEFKPERNSKITLEGFYKNYKKYPFSVKDQISLANLGSDFGVIGNEEVTSTSKGRSYGFEVFAQKKSYNGLYGLVSYTFVVSEFKDKNNNYIPSSWDNKHLLTITGGKKLQKNWEIGGKFRFVGGSPFTPYDINASSIIENYNVSNSGILDYNQLNTERYENYHQLDIRVDKTWYWKHFSLNFYFDIQNVYGSESKEQGYLIPTVDENGARIIDANDSSKYVLETVENTSGTILPRFGVIIDF